MEYFGSLNQNDKLLQLEQSVLALRAGIAELQSMEDMINQNQKEVHVIFMKHMSELKQIQQSLLVIKGQYQV